MKDFKYSKWVILWLKVGLVMVFFQIIIGGVTRLTGSGLSITKWEIVTGTLPPLSGDAWNKAFDLYKETPQYKKINKGMSMSEFKFIYFWEYFHRLWARSMGLVFIFPLLFFILKRWVDLKILKKLFVVFFLAGLAAAVGWIMVASGLVNRPWVNAYKLAIHLSIGFLLFGYLYWVYLYATRKEGHKISFISRRILKIFFVFLCFQIFFGGVMSGMKAGLFYPSWPDIDGSIIPQIIFNSAEWTVENFNTYENSLLLPAIVHVLHRTTAYVLFTIGLVFLYRLFKIDKNQNRLAISVFGILLISQVLLGILTLINCIGEIPVLLGVLHQGFAILLLTSTLYWLYRSKRI